MIRHHPTLETLLAHAAGTLADGPAVVVEAHAQGCPQCRATLDALDATGGQLLGELSPAPLEPATFERVLARLDVSPAVRPSPPRQASLALPQGTRLPAALRNAQIGRWFWVAPGVRYSRVRLPWAPAQNLMLLRVGGGRRVPHHSHGGMELTQVLWGGFRDGDDRYGPGDLGEADETTAHQPLADPEGCICLASLEGGLRLPWLTRLLGK
ncbi:transcriptional regulator [Gluconacetobacter liquefaciens]|uniref:ChrR-like anti-ECFsigma factor n=1 Tax=Gluconacetobacter liquefaciens TaxID=89584 RepID=A0A370FZR6_GLULI|nr:ChrR family anti-sigma-E factor [Gluconacetobacter liquefaciens]MBB2186986.1 transcriptional regulator [Gluconacetobacter liquefaciens]RDI36958.1 ChrR-like anti-ECFsigma factor [Gluconacetobacter liquefaciens]GBR00063.1 anti-sigma factor [Gluconacetobacter liquefaciens NRIC 0522]GEB38782.1 transcriptional regulator [Gluconacetobacter liquefaciens]